MGGPPDGREGAAGRVPTLVQRVEYVLVRLLAFALACTDVRGAARMGAALGSLLGAVDGRHREIAADNIRRAYGKGIPEREVRAIVDAVYENIGVTAAEFVHGPRRLRGRAPARWFRVTGAGPLKEAARGGPVLFLGAHFGNWEHAVSAARTVGFEVLSVARPLDNPLLDRWVTRIRDATGTPTVPKSGALRGLLRTARGGRSIAMLMDQNAGRHGRVVPFFGRPASTVAAGVTLARRLGIPMAVATLERIAPGFHRFRIGPPMYVRDGEGGEDEALARVNLALEERVRGRPGHWLWLHRRWRIKADWGFDVPPTEGRRSGS